MLIECNSPKMYAGIRPLPWRLVNSPVWVAASLKKMASHYIFGGKSNRGVIAAVTKNHLPGMPVLLSDTLDNLRDHISGFPEDIDRINDTGHMNADDSVRQHEGSPWRIQDWRGNGWAYRLVDADDQMIMSVYASGWNFVDRANAALLQMLPVIEPKLAEFFQNTAAEKPKMAIR